MERSDRVRSEQISQSACQIGNKTATNHQDIGLASQFCTRNLINTRQECGTLTVTVVTLEGQQFRLVSRENSHHNAATRLGTIACRNVIKISANGCFFTKGGQNKKLRKQNILYILMFFRPCIIVYRIISSTNFNAQFSLFINNMFVTLLSSTCFEH